MYNILYIIWYGINNIYFGGTIAKIVGITATLYRLQISHTAGLGIGTVSIRG